MNCMATDPKRAGRVANAVGKAFYERVSNVRLSANSMTASAWDPTVTPDAIGNDLLALALGPIIGLGLAFWLEWLDDT